MLMDIKNRFGKYYTQECHVTSHEPLREQFCKSGRIENIQHLDPSGNSRVGNKVVLNYVRFDILPNNTY